MTLRLQRKPSTQNYTEGVLYIDDQYFCDTLEDRVRNLPTEQKIDGKTAIPAGTYNIEWTYSQKFRKPMPLVRNVPWFQGIRIHSGNSAEDTSGCILVGKKCNDGYLTQSRITYQKLAVKLSSAIAIRHESVKIQIYNSPSINMQ